THVRYFDPFLPSEPDHPTREKAKPTMLAILFTDIEQELQAQTNSQTWFAEFDSLTKGVIEAGFPELGHGVFERSNAGKDDLRRSANLFGIARDFGRMPYGFDCLLHAPKVAHPVVDDDDHYLLAKDLSQNWVRFAERLMTSNWVRSRIG